MGVETGLIIAMAATAAASLGSAAVGAINNSKSLEAQRDMYDKQRADQLSDYNNRTGIKAQLQQYQESGINPAAVLGNVSGGSMSSVPAAPEIPNLENYGATFGQGITQTMEALAKIKGFQKQDAEVQNLLSQQRLTELQSSYQEGQNFLQQKYGDSEHAIGLQKMYADTMLAYADGRYKDSYVSLNKMIEKLKGEEFKHMQTENSQFGLILAKQLQLISAQVDSERAKPALMRSEMASNYGAAAESNANAKTINLIRKDVARYHEKLANITDTRDFVTSNTAWNEVQQSLYDLMASKLVPEQVVEAIKLARKKNDWYEVNELLGIVDEGVKAYGTYYGAKTGKGFVDAQNVRNDIDRDFKEYQKTHEKKKVYNVETGDVYYR